MGVGIASTRVLLGQERYSRRSRWELLANADPPKPAAHRPNPSLWDDTTISAAWIGHATVLINFFGFKIITDPVFSEYIGLNVMNFFTIGPRRLITPALSYDELPPLDLILVSHAHMDHLDTPTLRKFNREIPIVIAKNTFDVIEDMGFEQIYELDWKDWTSVADVRIEALQVKHFGWRYPWEKDRSKGFREGRSFNAYLLTKNGHSILFGGDTAYHEMFKPLKERNLQIDLAIMPIGAYDPWIRNHATPEQALEMTDHIGAKYILPIHWGTFIQSDEPTNEPIARLRNALIGQPDRMVIDEIGKEWTMERSVG